MTINISAKAILLLNSIYPPAKAGGNSGKNIQNKDVD